MNKHTTLSIMMITIMITSTIEAQTYRWQQEIQYDMDIVVDAPKHQFEGRSQVTYINHSPDTLHHFFYHLYFNAFQPNSMMDTRSRSILDPDGRVRDRIYHLDEDEIGYHKVKKLEMDGQPVPFEVVETTLEAKLPKAIMPGDTVTFLMEFDSQVPLQIRRSGRDNRENIDFSMAQWYPKVAEYDFKGWHTSPYVGREFFGVFGDFNVKITIDSSYTIGGTGYLQNPQEIGHGYQDPTQPLSIPNTKMRTWHFFAPDVHDFVWAADPDFVHYQRKTKDGVTVHVIYQTEGNPSVEHWKKLGDYTTKAIEFKSEKFGQYPWDQFTVIQGADGGMEYPMATLITGHRSLGSLVGVMVHELAHMWYYGVLATNESYYAWMDEGFTVYISNETMAHLFDRKGDPHINSLGGYLYLKDLGIEEPLTTHSDRYNTNQAYGTAAYTSGSIFLNQLGYIVGRDVLNRSLIRYFDTWKFRHPDKWDFIREVEKESGLELDWYIEDWTETTKSIDYGITSVETADNGTYSISLKRHGDHLMPVDLYLEYEDGSTEVRNIPMVIMRGAKQSDYGSIPYNIETDWRWVDDTYTLSVQTGGKKLTKVMIDPSLRMADIDRLNNTWPYPINRTFMEPASPNYTEYGYSWRPALWYGDLSGLRAGLSSYGSYIFGNRVFEASVMVTSGTINSYGVDKTDIDYYFSYEYKLNGWGLEANLKPELKRYYGINEEVLTLSKQIGEYGRLTPVRQIIKIGLFHQVKTAERNVSSLSGWDRGDVTGMRLSYEFGEGGKNGITFNSQAATSKKNRGASYASLAMDKSFEKGNLTTRFNLSFGSGSKNLASQYRMGLAGPTLEQMWNNPTYWSVANIDDGLINNLNLYPVGGNGFIGYGIQGIGSPDIAGNNFISATIWNTFKPVKSGMLAPFAVELFSGVGQSWNGLFLDDFPVLTGTGRNFFLASAGVGATYDVSSIRDIRKWTAQSKFLQNLKLSVRMPFYMNGLANNNDFGAWFIFGITDSF